MDPFPIISIIIFVMLVVVCSKKMATQKIDEMQNNLDRADKAYNQLQNDRTKLNDEKMELEDEAIKIFTLYEITKEITQSLSEEDAFEIFRKKLTEHVRFEECFFHDPVSEEIKKLKKDKDYFIFTLQDKKKKIGFLAIKGVAEADKEKVMILGHQYALALRRVNLYREIEKIAITDSLTGVHTRRYALERLHEEISRSKMRKRKMSFLMLDVDHFKSYNDKYGHLTGDQVLRELGVIIRDNIREIDIAGRFGGEEFCVVLPDTDREGAKFAAERIREATEKTKIKAYDAVVKVTVSIGISTYPFDGKNKGEIIDKADWALYRSKKQGRNRVSLFGVYDE